MFTRLVPNIRDIGLLSERIRPHYEQAGLGACFCRSVCAGAERRADAGRSGSGGSVTSMPILTLPQVHLAAPEGCA